MKPIARFFHVHPLPTMWLAVLALAWLLPPAGAEPSGFIPRDEPLRDLKTSATLKASNFGIRPDTDKNIAPALEKLIEHLATLSKPTLVSFEKGTYRVAVSKGNEKAVFALKNLKNLVIDGNGAEFIVNSSGTGFSRIDHCKNIIIRNFVVDGDPLPFTQGSVVGMDRERGTFDLKIDSGYREISNENLLEYALGGNPGTNDAATVQPQAVLDNGVLKKRLTLSMSNIQT